MRKITRGPKPARALRELGLGSDLPAVVPTTAGIIEALRGTDSAAAARGRAVYGAEPNRPLVEFLTAAGALVSTVAPYRYADAATDAAVQDLLERMRRGAVDAIAFTSKAQVERLFRAAPPNRCAPPWKRPASRRSGPVVAIRSRPTAWSWPDARQRLVHEASDRVSILIGCAAS